MRGARGTDVKPEGLCFKRQGTSEADCGVCRKGPHKCIWTWVWRGPRGWLGYFFWFVAVCFWINATFISAVTVGPSGGFSFVLVPTLYVPVSSFGSLFETVSSKGSASALQSAGFGWIRFDIFGRLSEEKGNFWVTSRHPPPAAPTQLTFFGLRLWKLKCWLEYGRSCWSHSLSTVLVKPYKCQPEERVLLTFASMLFASFEFIRCRVLWIFYRI